MSRPLTVFPNAGLIDELEASGVEKLPNAEISYRQQLAMLARFQRHGVNRKRWKRLQKCKVGGCPHKRCSAACWFGGRALMAHLTIQAYRLMRDLGLTLHFVSVALPQYRREISQLRSFSPNAMRQWLQRRLKLLEAGHGPLFVVGQIEISLELELDGTMFWGPHAHFILAGRVSEMQLRKALKPTKKLPRKFRSVVIKPIYNLANAISYCLKRAPEIRKAMKEKTGRQNRSPNPLRPEQMVELDRWLLRLSADQLLLLRNVRRVHERLTLMQDPS